MSGSNGVRMRRGVALIEALVALAVMAFGLLAVVGMQGTLRGNADIAKQRSEAVRIAQFEMENWRAFEQLDAAAGVTDFEDVASGTFAVVPGNNASYTPQAVVTPAAVGASAPKLKTVTMRVGWDDRGGRAADVMLLSAIAAITPEIAGSLALPGDRAVAQRPHGRHPGVPVQAVNDPGGATSRFTVPNSGGVQWVFNNSTGIITSVCLPATPCTPGDRFLISGFIAFATGAAPTPAEAELPTDAPVTGLGLKVVTTFPLSTADEVCYTEAAGSLRLAYYCAAPASATAPRLWSGTTLLTGIPIAGLLTGNSTAEYKVCRYTPADSHTPPGGNAAHPLDYVNLSGALRNQNFLVISAGNVPPPPAAPPASVQSYDCPDDDTGTAFINSNTYRHQPII